LESLIIIKQKREIEEMGKRQLTIYFNEDRAGDRELLKRLEEKAEKERRSKSATILAILEEHFRLEAEGHGDGGDEARD